MYRLKTLGIGIVRKENATLLNRVVESQIAVEQVHGDSQLT
jgi:hypothetical protein